MRALFDINVVVSAILFGGTPRSLVIQAIRGNVDLVTSPHLLGELQELLERKFGFSAASAAAIRTEFETLAEPVIPQRVPRVCRDSDDDQVLAAAVQGGADCIVTGDRDLLVLASYRGIEIVDPAMFATRMRL